MLEEINSLPRAEHELPADERYREMHLRERGANMRGHIVRAFVIVGISGRILRRELREERFEIGAHFGRGILLNEERCGGVPAKECQQSFAYALRGGPGADLAGEFDQPAPRAS